MGFTVEQLEGPLSFPLLMVCTEDGTVCINV